MIKKFLLFFIVIVIIVFSFIMPKLFLQIEDLSRENEIFTRSKKEDKKIDVQAEKIYLVRFIHDIYEFKNTKVYDNDKKSVTITMPITEKIKIENPREELKNEIFKFVTNNIIKEINIEEFDSYTEVANIFSHEYTVVSCSLLKEKEDWIGINVEEKTGKIISIDFPTSFLKKDIDKKQQLENYTKYLDLDIIDDWKYENDILKSEKAQLAIVLDETGEACMLTVAPIEIYEEYIKEDNKINNEYEIIEKSKK